MNSERRGELPFLDDSDRGANLVVWPTTLSKLVDSEASLLNEIQAESFSLAGILDFQIRRGSFDLKPPIS